MKIVIFQAGLGNQIFEYTFMQYIREHIDADVRYQVRNDHSHNGFEFDKWFVQDMRPAPWYYRLYIRVMDKLMYNLKLKNPYYVQQKYYDFLDGKDSGCNSNIFDGYWVRKLFYKDGYVRFRMLPLSDRNAEVTRLMEDTESVSIHVRRGDYLLPKFAKMYGGICTEEYYKKAISRIKEKAGNKDLHFFVFSDDIEWVRQNLSLENATYIDWNTGKDSIYDMYLMSKCRHNIIANSTFSFWAARLNDKAKTVVYPKKWYNEPWTAPDIFPEEWKGI